MSDKVDKIFEATNDLTFGELTSLVNWITGSLSGRLTTAEIKGTVGRDTDNRSRDDVVRMLRSNAKFVKANAHKETSS